MKIFSFLVFIPLSCFSQVHSKKLIDKFTPLENKIIDSVHNIREVIERSNYVEQQTKNKRHLQFAIWEKPSTDSKYYWVKVMEDNGASYYTHFNFFVDSSLSIKYYDVITDSLIDLSSWQKDQMK